MSDNYRKLLSMAAYGDRNGCLQLIPKMSADDINTPIDDQGTTFIQKAITFNDYEVVTMLLKYGANPNKLNNSKISCWSYACSNRDVNALLCLSAYVKHEDNEEAIFQLFKNLLPKDHIIPASDSLEYEPNIIRVLDVLFESQPVQWMQSCETYTTTYLHIAIDKGYTDVAQYLLQKGYANFLTHIDEDGKTPIQVAEKKYKEQQTQRQRSWSFELGHERQAYHYDNEDDDDEEEDDDEENGEEEDGDEDNSENDGFYSDSTEEEEDEEDEQDDDEDEDVSLGSQDTPPRATIRTNQWHKNSNPFDSAMENISVSTSNDEDKRSDVTNSNIYEIQKYANVCMLYVLCM
jgi:hypothetical protein